MTINIFSSGVNTTFSTELNENYNSFIVQEVYTGTDFNTASSGTTSGSDTASHELTAISSANLAKADYLIIDINKSTSVAGNSNSGSSANVTLKIETKEVGGSYSDSMTSKTMASMTREGAVSNSSSLTWIHTLTSGEKSNGIQVKITTVSTNNSGSGESTSASISNTQTVLTLGA